MGVRALGQWGGIVDVCPDASPSLSKTPVQNLYLNCGWGTGGFKATPGSGWAFAHTIAQDAPHPLNAAFSLDRFRTGFLIDEHGAAAVAHQGFQERNADDPLSPLRPARRDRIPLRRRGAPPAADAPGQPPQHRKGRVRRPAPPT